MHANTIAKKHRLRVVWGWLGNHLGMVEVRGGQAPRAGGFGRALQNAYGRICIYPHTSTGIARV